MPFARLSAVHRRRLIVFTGPVLSDVDPVYRGVGIPLQFFKVAAFLYHGQLAATGYVVDQTPQLAGLPDVPRPGVIGDTPRWAHSAPSRSPSATSPP